MIQVLANNKQALEKELQERVSAFFKANDEVPQSVFIEMDFNETGQSTESSTIHILVKDACKPKKFHPTNA